MNCALFKFCHANCARHFSRLFGRNQLHAQGHAYEMDQIQEWSVYNLAEAEVQEQLAFSKQNKLYSGNAKCVWHCVAVVLGKKKQKKGIQFLI